MSDLLDVEKVPKVENSLVLTYKNASVFKPYLFAETVIRCMKGWSLH